jgi:hypothetical protein
MILTYDKIKYFERKTKFQISSVAKNNYNCFPTLHECLSKKEYKSNWCGWWCEVQYCRKYCNWTIRKKQKHNKYKLDIFGSIKASQYRLVFNKYTSLYSPDDALIDRNISSLYLMSFSVKRNQVFPVGFNQVIRYISNLL